MNLSYSKRNCSELVNIKEKKKLYDQSLIEAIKEYNTAKQSGNLILLIILNYHKRVRKIKGDMDNSSKQYQETCQKIQR